LRAGAYTIWHQRTVFEPAYLKLGNSQIRTNVAETDLAFDHPFSFLRSNEKIICRTIEESCTNARSSHFPHSLSLSALAPASSATSPEDLTNRAPEVLEALEVPRQTLPGQTAAAKHQPVMVEVE
jgi:hypothetical protein